MEPRGVDFYAYEVSDLGKSIEFYRDVLGLELLDEWGGAWAELRTGTATIALVVPPARPHWGVALAVQDGPKVLDELRAKGVRITMGPYDSEHCWGCIVEDPDGNPIWLHERHDGTYG
jgi:catechol 2,3-dioxygenase-like lactoylglutathione lyase family enzyme